jgi:hypothetical protein
MRRFIASLLAVPLLAVAQAEPPPTAQAPLAAPAAATAPPPDAPPPAAPCPPLPAPTRDRWYIGFGVGGGSGRASDTSGDLALERWVDPDHLTAFLQLQAGVTLRPGLLVGGELNTLRTGSDTALGKKTAQVSNLDAMVTWYPQEKGFFLRGGGGLTVFTREWPGLKIGKYPGANLAIGAGYAFWIGRTFNLTLHLDHSRQWYGKNVIHLSGSSFTVGWLGFDWY